MNAILPIETDHAEMSPPQECFATTHWSLVLAAAQELPFNAREALEKLCRTYWPPLYVYVRRKGYNPEDAADLTQGFFARFLEDGAIKVADRKRGKFRSFLLGSLQHFLSNEWDRAQTQKRGGGKRFISLDDDSAEVRYRCESVSDGSPEKLFERRWALTVLEQALDRLRKECRNSGKATQFEHLKIFLSDETAHGEYNGPADHLNMSVRAVAVAVCRLRERYRELVHAEIAQTVTSLEEAEEEMRHLFAALS